MKRITTSELIDRHRTDPRYNTDICPENPDTFIRHHGWGTYGIFAPKTRGKLPGCVGILDMSELYNELTDSRTLKISKSVNHREYYHRPGFIDPTYDWQQYFKTGIDAAHVNPVDRFIRSNWGDLSNPYTPRPEFIKSDAPDSVERSDSQAGLGEYDDVSPCSYSEVRECSCCRCPECDSVAIRARKNRIAAERYACGNPACDAEPFESPTVKPTRRGD